MATQKRTTAERFWSKVLKTDWCWLWQGARQSSKSFRDGKGYGNFSFWRLASGRMATMGTHRVSWMLTHGDIPEGAWVLHKCDHPTCVRPDHLFLGTHADNMADAAAKGRMKHPQPRSTSSRLTPDDVRAIRIDKRKNQIIAADYGLAQHNSVWRIKHRISFAWID